MTLEELKQFAGYYVQVSLNRKEALALIETQFSRDGMPELSWPVAPEEGFQEYFPIPLTEADAAGMALNGSGVLFSKIELTTEGGKRRL